MILHRVTGETYDESSLTHTFWAVDLAEANAYVGSFKNWTAGPRIDRVRMPVTRPTMAEFLNDVAGA